MRVPLLWVWRLLLGGFAVAYLASSALQSWLPPLLPFLAAAAVEAQFFVAGLRRGGGRSVAASGRGPQPRDLAEFGWANRTVVVRREGAELVLRPAEMADAEIVEWLGLHEEELEALGPGRHELAPIADAASPVALHVAPRPAPPQRNIRRRLLQALAVLALLAGVFVLDELKPGWGRLPASTRTATVALFDREASRIAGHSAYVICDVAGRHVGYVQDADGLAEVGGGRMWLTPDVCYRLYRIAHTHRSGGTASGHAIAVLAHEAWHLHGESSEAIANCYAYQSGVSVGEALGLRRETARALMREQLADNPADFADAPAYVVPAGCRRGGGLDLRLDGSHFP
jgi:hypothetical protein